MKTVHNSSVFDIAPGIIKNDNQLNALLQTFDYLHKKYFLGNYKELVNLDRLNEIKEWQVDLLAEELHVDFYLVEATLEEKREAVRNSISIHNLKGTVKAVEDALDIFYTNAKIVPWYENDGDPGTFSVNINRTEIRTEELKELVKLLREVKRETQHLKKITFSNDITEKDNFYQHIKIFKEIVVGGENGNF